MPAEAVRFVLRRALRLRGGRWLVVLAMALAVSACSLWSPSIRDIKTDVRRFEGQTVTVRGEVVQSVNLLLVRGYIVKDETGQIGVVSDRAVPRPGQSVVVTGQVEQLLSLGSESIVVIREPRSD